MLMIVTLHCYCIVDFVVVVVDGDVVVIVADVVAIVVIVIVAAEMQIYEKFQDKIEPMRKILK